MTGKIPKFLTTIPAGYYDTPDPYKNPEPSKYDLRSLAEYARLSGKEVTELTEEEASCFPAIK